MDARIIHRTEVVKFEPGELCKLKVHEQIPLWLKPPTYDNLGRNVLVGYICSEEMCFVIDHRDDDTVFVVTGHGPCFIVDWAIIRLSLEECDE